MSTKQQYIDKQFEKENTHKSSNPDMLNSLTSMRFFAALMVFSWHTHVFSSYLDKFQFGYLGVSFFYMLSGFILTYVYFEKLKRKNINGLKKFYIARIAKLYPVHILTLVVAIPLFLSTVNNSFPIHTTVKAIGIFFANLSLTQSFFPNNDINFSFNGVAWSISVELFFYALFPLLILLISQRTKLFSVKSALLAMVVMWLTLMFILLPQQSFVNDWRFYIFPLVRLPDFAMGMMLGIIFLKTKQENALSRYIQKTNFTKFEILSLGLLAIGVSVSVFMPQSVRFSAWLMPFWAIVIFVFAQQKGIVSKLLSYRPFVFLGEISFSFYMVHQLIIRYVEYLHISSTATIVTSLLISICISSGVYMYFEEPMRIRVKDFLEKKFIYKQRRKDKEVIPELETAPAVPNVIALTSE